MALQDWSANDISKARNCFLNGLAIKEIAKELGRSTTATNKALSRFGIRKPKRNQNEISIQQNSIQLKKKQKAAPLMPSFEYKALRKEFENWVEFSHVCEFLGQQKICIYEQSTATLELERRQFRVGEKILSAGQVLIMANKMRTENNMKAFLVEELSW